MGITEILSLTTLLYYIGIFLSISLHESAHAYMAHYLGDLTPKAQGRLTLNPIKHIEPIGAILIILFGFGWGRPVQVNPYSLKDPKRAWFYIAFAGPITNLIIAIIIRIILIIFPSMGFSAIPLASLYYLNIVLFVFNLLPLYPLDGSKIVYALLPNTLAQQWEETARISPFILILLLATGALTTLVMYLAFPILYILG